MREWPNAEKAVEIIAGKDNKTNGPVDTSKFKKSGVVDDNGSYVHVPAPNEVVIIGSGPSVLKKELGLYIDSAESVARINDYYIQGYEDYVGSRIDYWVSGAGKQTQLRNRSIKGIYPILIFPLSKLVKGDYNTLSGQVRRNLNMSIDAFHVVPYSIIQYLVQSSGLRYPSTGLLTILYFTHTLGVPKVYIYGFDSFQEKRHYYDSIGDKNISESHQWQQEKEFINKLAAKGTIMFLDDAVRNGLLQKKEQEEVS
jgi:hypothetical protein